MIATETGLLVYQPAEQPIELQLTELVGAVESDWAVKLVPEPLLPALSWALTEPDWLPAALVKL